jgi:hypothetical protein
MAPAASDGFARLGSLPIDLTASLRVSLYPACSACPEVEIQGDEVRIGEAGNLAVLKKDEWNVLVGLIQSGQLTKA